jgi:hypothetical protein
MKIFCHPNYIRRKLVKQNWTTAYFTVEDIGFVTCWGNIYDRETNEKRSWEYYSLEEEWEPYDEVSEFINKLRVIE